MAIHSCKRSLIRSLALITLASVLFVSGCWEKTYSDPQMTAQSTEAVESTATPTDYESVKERLDKFTLDINAYMKDHISEASVKTVTGTTPAGNSAECIYTVSADGVYRSLQMIREDSEKRVTDEYFDLGDALFVAHSVVYTDNTYEPTVKYYITDGIVYKLDRETSSLFTVADLNTQDKDQLSVELDMYLSFDDIVSIYG